MAAKAGQVSQAELLTVYGADPGAPDSKGKTPIAYARLVNRFYRVSLFEFVVFCTLIVILTCINRESGHNDLAERLVEIQYELTDRLAFYLCGRKPGIWCFI